MSDPTLPSALAALIGRFSVNPAQWFSRGGIDLRIDDLPRIKVGRGRRGQDVVLETRLANLPSSARDREELLAWTMLRVTAGASRQVGAITLSADGERLVLQAGLDGADERSFEAAFEAYLNEVGYWKSLIGTRRS